jgi:hypothetical protein
VNANHAPSQQSTISLELFLFHWQAQELTLPTRKESLNKFDPGPFDIWTPTFSAKIPMLFEPYKHPSHQNLFRNIAAGTTSLKTGYMGTLTKHDGRLLLVKETRFKEFYG